MYKNILLFGTISLFCISAITPIAFGLNNRTSFEESIEKILNFNSYHIYEIPRNTPHTSLDDLSNTNIVESNQIDAIEETLEPLDRPIGPPWPMYCHDTHHTGRSPYSTANTTGIEKWRFNTIEECSGSPVIDKNSVIYIGAGDLFAVYPNGTMKWMYDSEGRIVSAPAIDENGILYVGVIYRDRFFAIDSNNGKVVWNFMGVGNVWSSPAIGNDGTIYFGSQNDNIYALYPNGTLKWKYRTSDDVFSSPAIGDDGTVYCGSDDSYLYALYPNNGTVKWKFNTGDWVGRGPSIGDDGTIYFGSWDGYLYAVYPNGTSKWKIGGYLPGTTPITGADGTIYVGSRYLTAIYPNNGTIKWKFSFGSDKLVYGGSPCISSDGTIYVGVTLYRGSASYGGEIIAVNNDGTEKWRKKIASLLVMSAPAIDENGTVYIGSWNDGSNNEWGFLHAFGYPGPNPLTPTVSGPSSGKPGTPYTYTFTSVDPDGDQVSYYIDWGDGDITDWTDFQPSGDSYSESHTWITQGTHIIRAKAKDTDGFESDWGELQVTMPRDKVVSNSLLLRLLERFPLLQKIPLFLTI